MKSEAREKRVKQYFPVLLVFALMFASHGSAFAAKDKDTLIVVDQYDATTMDPVAHNDVASSRACHEVYDTLVFLNAETKEIEPGLAEKWEFLSGASYKFYLRRGVKFHNGEEMTADDVKYSVERAKSDVGAKVRTYTQNIDYVEVLDDYTVIIHLKLPDYSFFPSLVHSWGNILHRETTEAAGDSFGMNPVGTGPFKFVSWQKGNKYVLERFDDHWGPKAKIKRLEVRSVPEPTSRTIELESGGADVAYPIVTNDLKRIEENENLVLYRVPQSSVTYMGFNLLKKPLDDIRVRRAIYAALDTVGIQKVVWRGVGKVPGSLVTEAIPHSIDGEVAPHRQDVELAKKLLADAGVENLKLGIWSNERKERVDMATIIQAQLGEIGIETEIQVLEWGAYLNGLQDKKHDLFLLGWVSGMPHPNFCVAGLLESTSGTNFTFCRDGKLDEMLAKGRAAPEAEERAQIYRDMQLYINEQLPMIYLHNDESIAGAQKNVKGFTPSYNQQHSFRTVYFED